MKKISSIILTLILVLFNTNIAFADGIYYYPNGTIYEIFGNDCGIYNGLEYRIKDSKISIERYLGQDKEVIIPSEINGMKVTNIARFAFAYNTFLTSIKIPSTVNRIEVQAFDGCTSLTNIEMSGVKYIGGWSFRDCDSLVNLKLPNSLVTIEQYAFMDCDSLTNVEMPEELLSIEEGAFSYCRSLKNIKMPQRLKYLGVFAFSNCYSLESINIPRGLEVIEPYAFYGCSALSNVNLPQGLSCIDDGAFMYCKSLTRIEIPDSVSAMGDDIFYKCNKLTIYGSPGSAAIDYARINNIPFKTTVSIKKITGIKQSYNSISSLKLNWNKDSKVSGYYVYRSTSKNGPYKKIATKSGYNNNTFTDSNLSSGKTYYYKVRAYKKINSKYYYGNYSDIYTASTQCSKPTITVTSPKTKTTKVSWKKVNGASGYQIYRAVSKNGIYSLNKTITNASTLSYTNTGLIKGKTYYYKVRAYKLINGIKVFSDYSLVKSIKVK